MCRSGDRCLRVERICRVKDKKGSRVRVELLDR